MQVWNAIGAAITLVVFFIVMAKLSQSKKDKLERTQDFFRFKNITDEGIIELPEGVYRAMLEIDPINMHLKTPEEQRIIWARFRSMVNALHVSYTFLIQSRHKEIKNYLLELRQVVDQMPTPQLARYGHDLANYLESEMTERNVKDHRYYISLEVNPYQKESELDLGSTVLSDLASGLQKNISKQEADDLAKQELLDSMAIVATYLKGIGINVYRMNKNAVLEMSYSALNRDLAPMSNFASIIYASSIHTTSLTEQLLEQAQKEYEEIQRRDYFVQISDEKESPTNP